MPERNDFLKRYLGQAPVFLAMERAIECRLISKIGIERPILDLGCGDGLFASILFSRPAEVGIDISFTEIMTALNRKAYKNTLAGDLSRLPLKTGCMRTIICNSVMEHIPDLKAALQEARRILAPGGKFIITIPTDNYERFLFYPRLFSGLGLNALADRYRETMNRVFRHYHTYTSPRWVKIIEENGFKILRKIPYCPREVLGLTDFYLPFSSLSWLNKKILKRWILWPGFRRVAVRFLEPILRKRYLYEDIKKEGCLLIEATGA